MWMAEEIEEFGIKYREEYEIRCKRCGLISEPPHYGAEYCRKCFMGEK